MGRGAFGNGFALCMTLGALCLGFAAGLGAAHASEGPEAPSILNVATAGAISNSTYVGSDATPTVSVEAAEGGGSVTLYSDSACATAVSAPASVPDSDGPHVIDMAVSSDLAAGLHHIHVRHEKPAQASECSNGVAYRVIQPMEAVYRVEFAGAFTTDALAAGVGVPGGAHFTTLIGAVHNQGVVFWERGGLASAGTEVMAETGGTGQLRSEVMAAGQDVLGTISQGPGGGATPAASFVVKASGEHASVTLASMVAPSPDWFVGVSGLPLLDADGHWEHQIKVDLFPYDAGTEDGERFSLSNDATVPHVEITSLRDAGLFYGAPLATLQLERVALASNLAQEGGQGALFFGHEPDGLAQGFRTGSSPGGYTLDGVIASFGSKAGSPGDVRVSIAADDAGSPGETVSVLNGSNPDVAGLYVFAADGDVLLGPDADYYVVFEVVDYLPGNAYRLAYTGSDAEDSGAAPGWSISNALLGNAHAALGGNSAKISIQGEAAPP